MDIVFQMLITRVFRGPNCEVFVAGFYLFPIFLFKNSFVTVWQEVTKFSMEVISVANFNNLNYVMD